MLGPTVKKLQTKNRLTKRRKFLGGSVSSWNFQPGIFLYFFPKRYYAKVYLCQVSEGLGPISNFGEFFNSKKGRKTRFFTENGFFTENVGSDSAQTSCTPTISTLPEILRLSPSKSDRQFSLKPLLRGQRVYILSRQAAVDYRLLTMLYSRPQQRFALLLAGPGASGRSPEVRRRCPVLPTTFLLNWN